MDDNNLFDDKDNALDYVIYEECGKEVKKTNNNKTGCLGVIAFLLILPAAGLLLWRWV